MAEQSMHLQTAHGRGLLDAHRDDDRSATEPTLKVEATVFAVIPEYRQVKVRDREGHVYALTSKTAGIELSELHEGQSVLCTVTRHLPRVLSAAALA